MDGALFLKEKIRRVTIDLAAAGFLIVGLFVIVPLLAAPQLAAFFAESAARPSLTVRIVISLGAFWLGAWFWAGVVLFALALIFWIFARTPKGKKTLSASLLRLPAVSPVVKKINIARTISKLNSLFVSGVSLGEALATVARETANPHYAEALAVVAGKVKAGERFSAALRPQAKLFSLTVIQMIEVGEETGALPKILEKMSDFFEKEAAAALDNVVAVIEPVLFLIIGSLIGFFAVSILQPLIQFVF